jgi:4-carboxymuconolactone decarboxylase
MAEPEEQLRRLALHDEECIRSVLAMDLKDDGTSGLDLKSHALIRLGALLALGAALDAGATAEEILGTLIAVAPISGVARVVLAIPDVALPIGYDIDAAFEELDDDPP